MHPMAIIFWYQILFNAVLSSFICCTFMDGFCEMISKKIQARPPPPLILPLFITCLHHPPYTVLVLHGIPTKTGTTLGD